MLKVTNQHGLHTYHFEKKLVLFILQVSIQAAGSSSDFNMKFKKNEKTVGFIDMERTERFVCNFYVQK